jgi:hypothetical protein
MFNEKKITNSITKNLNWFQNSGIMNPVDGTWGVAERIFLTENNNALEHILDSFPANIMYDKHGLVEHRRPDCNFQTAIMFLLAGKLFNNQEYHDIANNILSYLYKRSGLRNQINPEYPKSVWNWSNAKWLPNIWFDDNAWNCVITLWLGKDYPELDKKYKLKKRGIELAYALANGFTKQFDKQVTNEDSNKDFIWLGNLCLPHWGSLVSMAMATAYAQQPDNIFKQTAKRYNTYINNNSKKFNSSEYAYIVIGESFCSAVFSDRCFKNTACRFADCLIDKQDVTTGNIPAEHYESPNGKHLVDTIYTINWSLLALQNMSCLYPDKNYKHAFLKIVNLLIDIQDENSAPYLKGCWRGMYDLKSDTWGGGDKFEGGANSIYSGWTNAPITISLLHLLSGKSLLDSLPKHT